jgi:hypothetical protein
VKLFARSRTNGTTHDAQAPVVRRGVRLEGYRAADHFEGGVTVRELVSVALPLDRILKEGIGSLGLLAPPPLMSILADEHLPRTGADALTGRSNEVRYLRDDGSERAVQGLVVHEGSISAVSDFLLDHYLPPPRGGALADLVRRAQRLPRDQGQLSVEDALRGAPDGTPDLYGGANTLYGPSGRARRRVRRSACNGPVLDRETFEEEFSRAVGTATDVVHVSPLSWFDTVVVAPVAVSVRGRQIPRLASLLPVESSDGLTFLLHDGRVFRWLRSSRDLSPELSAAFETSGVVGRTCYPILGVDLLPLPQLEARCLVRMPPQGELAEALAHTRRRRPRSRALSLPGYVLDSRVPVPLTGRETVIEDPDAAAFVLTHTIKGIYLPEEPEPLSFPVERLAGLDREESWLVLAGVGGGL